MNVKKAQINFQDSSGNTALMLAAKLGREEVVSFLLEAGAKRTLKNSDGQTAFKMATPAAAKLIKDFATGGSSGTASSTAASSSSSSSSADKSPSTRRRNAPSSASSPSRGGASSSSSMTAAEMRRQLKIYEQENANRADLSKKVAALEDKLARSEGELNDAVAAAQQEAEEQSQQQQARIAALEQQLAEAAKTAQQAQAGKAEAEAKAAQLEADMAAKQSESAARIASLEAAVEAAAAAKDSAAQESFAAEEKVIELEKANAELVAEKESIAQEVGGWGGGLLCWSSYSLSICFVGGLKNTALDAAQLEGEAAGQQVCHAGEDQGALQVGGGHAAAGDQRPEQEEQVQGCVLPPLSVGGGVWWCNLV